MSRFVSSRAAQSSRAFALLGAAATSVAIAGCQLDKVTVERTTPTLVVHGVLNPLVTTQTVLLERTLTGQITASDTVFDPADPIVTGGGIPVSGASVDISDSLGNTVHGVEDVTVTPDHTGAGVYRFALQGGELRRGTRYDLRIHTLEGEDASASTRLPNPEVTSSGALSRTFNRDHDTLALQWNATPMTRAYTVRVESPFGPFFLFTDSLSLRLAGGLRNPFANDLQRLFVPGFRQDLTIAAVDSNFYDYYRTTNDPFTGSGIISRVKGGIGVFGSLVILNSGTITVTADQTEPIEGRFRLQAAPQGQTALVLQLTLYVESPGARDDLPSAISGRFIGTGTSTTTGGVLGTQLGSAVSFALVDNSFSGDTLGVFLGTLNGGTLSGAFRGVNGTFVYQKQ